MGPWYTNSITHFAFGIVAGAGTIVLISRCTEIASRLYALVERNSVRESEHDAAFSQNERETFENSVERLSPIVDGRRHNDGMLLSPPDVDEDCDKNDGLVDILFQIARDQAHRDCFIHRGITCNMCNASPVCGTRYKCANCLDYDVCEVCEPGDQHNRTHIFLKIKYPVPPLANPKAICLKPFYTGML